MKLVLPLFPTTNHMYGSNGSRKYLTAEAKKWKEETQWRAKVLHTKPLVGAVTATILFYLKFDRDVDNLKLLLDSLKGFAYKDDSQVTELHIYKLKDKDNPRVEVEVV